MFSNPTPPIFLLPANVHLYPSKQKALADKLNEDRGNADVIMERKETE